MRHYSVDLGGGLGTSRPAEVELVGEDGRNCVLRIAISEGKNRQIRRMLHSVRRCNLDPRLKAPSFKL